jgi:hypothetical protein
MAKNPPLFFLFFCVSWLLHGLTARKNDASVLGMYLFVSFYKSEKEIKVYSVISFQVLLQVQKRDKSILV